MNETNILRQSLPVFLSEGAFLRHPDGGCVLAIGPSKTLKGHEKTEFSWFSMVFFADQPKRLSFAHVLKISQLELVGLLKEFLGDFVPKLPAQSHQPDPESFASDLNTILGKIDIGEIEKAVPIVEQSWSYTPDFKMKAHMILKSLEAPGHIFPYGMWNPSGGFIGVTPEVLLQTNDGANFMTMALAGTLPKGRGVDGNELLRDPKEMREHQKVITDISQQLQSFGKLQISKTKVIELPTLYHLQTQIALQTQKACDLSTLVKALHPTAALGVFPRQAAGNWYRELAHQEHREYFGAPFGYQDEQGRGLILVSIRNLVWDQQQTYLRAGCGIVQGSVMQKEWQELAKKRESTLQQLGLS